MCECYAFDARTGLVDLGPVFQWNLSVECRQLFETDTLKISIKIGFSMTRNELADKLFVTIRAVQFVPDKQLSADSTVTLCKCSSTALIIYRALDRRAVPRRSNRPTTTNQIRMTRSVAYTATCKCPLFNFVRRTALKSTCR